MNFVLLIARLVLALVFIVAGVAKLADPAGSRKSMLDFGAPKGLAPLLGILLPIAELVCAAALLPARLAWYGAAGILALLVVFIAGIGFNMVRGRRPDCHCFGQLHSTPIGWNTVLRNTCLALIAAIIVWQGREGAGGSIWDWSNSLGRTESVALALGLAIVVLAAFQLWALMHVLRQNGRLMLRIEALESRPAGPVETPQPGLAVNSDAPGFSLKDLAGDTVSFEMLRQRGKPMVLLFSEPGCGACDAALPDISQWQSEYADRLLIVPISRGSSAENEKKAKKFGLQNVLIQTDREVANAYLADQSPSAVLVTDGHIASPLAIGAEAIRGLVTTAVLPPSVKMGDTVPSLSFSDLKGRLVDLGKLGRRTIILFWNPACGFCQQMLDDLKAWERNRANDAPELLVISSGSLESSREEGFEANVLLDPYFAASQVFNSGGTPSAVLVDAEGQVASVVAVGAPDVLGLLGPVPADLSRA